MEEQLNLVHKVIDVVDCPNRSIFVTLLRYEVDNPETSYAQVRLFGRKKMKKNFSKLCMSTIDLTNLYIFLTSWIQYMIKYLLTNPTVMFCKKYLQLFTLIFYFFNRVRMSWNIGDNRNLFLKLKTKLGLYHVELKSKDSPGKITLTLVETQQLPGCQSKRSKFLFKMDNLQP